MLKKSLNNSLLSKNCKVVAIGGGTGLGRLLSSLAYLGDNLTGIVATTDNGGSTGKLREETGCIAWGDLRNCLSQLTSAQDIRKRLFEYRFEHSGQLDGHSLGNLMLLALDNMCVRPLDTINLFRKFLDVEPNIYPMTETPAHLSACDEAGCDIFGEVNIDARTTPPQSLQITPNVQAPDEVIEAIKNAELILLGPGSFFTSILPPLLVPNIRNAIANSKAVKFFVASMLAEQGAAGNLGLKRKMQWLDKYVCPSLVDLVIWPQSRKEPMHLRQQLLSWDLVCKSDSRIHDLNKLSAAINHAFHIHPHRLCDAS